MLLDKIPALIELNKQNAITHWKNYLSVTTWDSLSDFSKLNLVNSLFLEKLVHDNVLPNLKFAVSSLALAIEKEISITFFDQFREIIRKSGPYTGDNLQSPEAITYKILKYAKGKPTLGAYPKILERLINNNDDEHTDLFNNIRIEFNSINDSWIEKSKDILEIIIEKAPSIKMTIIDMRNKSSHAESENESINWGLYFKWMNKCLEDDKNLFDHLIALRK